MNTDPHHRMFPGWSVCLLVFTITFFVFSPSLNHAFLNWDDDLLIVENPQIKHLDAASVVAMFTTYGVGNYTPLERLSCAVDWQLWGTNPWGFHLTNVLLHSLNATLVYLLALSLFRGAFAGSVLDASVRWSALCTALAYALHPLRVESVAWVSERRDVLAGFFALISTWVYVRAAWNVSGSERSLPPGAKSLVTIAFFASLLSKGNAVVLPVVLLILDIYPLHRVEWKSPRHGFSRLARLAGEKWMMFVGALVIGAVVIMGQRSVGSMTDAQVLDWKTRLATAMVSGTHYLWKIIYPVGLNPLYLLHHPYSWGQMEVWLGFCLFAGVSILFILVRRSCPAALWIWIAYLVLIGPFLGILPIGRALAADRYTYLAAIPFSLGIGAMMLWCWARQGGSIVKTMIPTLAVAGLLVSWTWGTSRQIDVWKDSVSLWSHSVSLDDKNAVAWGDLGEALAARQEHERAIVCHRRAVEIDPRFLNAWFNLGNEYTMIEKYPEAVAAYRCALEIHPKDRRSWHNLGVAYFQLHQIPKALESYKQAMQLGPSMETEYNMGQCLEALGDTRAAVASYQSAARQGMAEGWIQWSELVLKSGKPGDAIEILREGMKTSQDLRIYLAYADQALTQRNPRAEDLELIRMVLTDADRRMEGKSEKVRLLLERLNKKAAHP